MSTPYFIAAVVFSMVGYLVMTRDTRSGRPMYRDRLDRLGRDRSSPGCSMDASEFSRETLPRLRINPAANEARPKIDLKQRIRAAGFYRKGAVQSFSVVRGIMMAVPAVLLAVSYARYPQYVQIECLGALAFTIAGYLVPNMWLDRKAAARQRSLRKGLPDAMDLCVICLEGGLGFTATIQRIADVLGGVHPALALELKIVFKRIHMGMPVGEAFAEFGKRSRVNEIRQLAAVIGEAERLGGGLTGSLRGHAQALREQRAQRAEEQAHKAGVKILFPTVGFILPALFVVMMGPAVVRIAQTLMKN